MSCDKRNRCSGNNETPKLYLEEELATYSSTLGTSMDRGPLRATVHGVTNSMGSRLSMDTHKLALNSI